MSELLIVKVGAEYLRFAANDFERCPFDKASVFPMEQVEEVKLQCRRLAEASVAAVLMKLIIIEEPYTE